MLTDREDYSLRRTTVTLTVSPGTLGERNSMAPLCSPAGNEASAETVTVAGKAPCVIDSFSQGTLVAASQESAGLLDRRRILRDTPPLRSTDTGTAEIDGGMVTLRIRLFWVSGRWGFSNAAAATAAG